MIGTVADRAAFYAPGRAVALVAARSWAVVDALPTDRVVTLLWNAMVGGAPFRTLAGVLAGEGTEKLPSFALLASDGDGLRLLLRGNVIADLADPDTATTRLDAGALCTWLEHVVGSDAVVAVMLRETVGPSTTFPTEGGIVFAERLEIARAGSLTRPEPQQEAAGGTAPPPVDESVTFADYLLGVAEDSDRTLTPSDVSSPNPLNGAAPGLATATTPVTTPVQVARVLAPGELLSVPWETAPSSPTESPGNDDGDDHTMVRPRVVPYESAPSKVADALTPTVHAVRCETGHPNPPGSVVCRSCAEEIVDRDAVLVPRPSLGILRLWNGDHVELDRDVVVGRRPTLSGEEAARPHLLKVNNPSFEVSRNHVAVVLDGWDVFVRDLGSKNGTVVRAPGEKPRLAPEAELVPIGPGTEIVIAEGVSFRYEVRR